MPIAHPGHEWNRKGTQHSKIKIVYYTIRNLDLSVQMQKNRFKYELE